MKAKTEVPHACPTALPHGAPQLPHGLPHRNGGLLRVFGVAAPQLPHVPHETGQGPVPRYGSPPLGGAQWGSPENGAK